MKKIALVFLMGLIVADASFNGNGNNVHISNYNGDFGEFVIHATNVDGIFMDVMKMLKLLTPEQVQQELQKLKQKYNFTVQYKNVRIEGNGNGGNIPLGRRRQHEQPKRQQQQANAGFVGNNVRYTEYIDNIRGIKFRAFNVDKRFMDAIRYLQTAPLHPDQIEYQLKQLQREGYLMEIGSPLQDINVGHDQYHNHDSWNVQNHDDVQSHDQNNDHDSYNVQNHDVFNDVRGHTTWTGQQGKVELQPQKELQMLRKQEQERIRLWQVQQQKQRRLQQRRDQEQRRLQQKLDQQQRDRDRKLDQQQRDRDLKQRMLQQKLDQQQRDRDQKLQMLQQKLDQQQRDRDQKQRMLQQKLDQQQRDREQRYGRNWDAKLGPFFAHNGN